MKIIEGYAFEEVPKGFLAINPHIMQPDGFLGYRIMDPQAPFKAGHPVLVYEGGSFKPVEGMSTMLPQYAWRFGRFHSLWKHPRKDNLLKEVLERNKKLVEGFTRIKTNHVFLESFLGLFDERDNLELILEVEERMEFGI